MLEDFYLDTSIWIDFYEKRGINGVSALRLILKIIKEGLKIAYSDLHIMELKNLGYSQYEIASLFTIIKPDHISRVHIYKEQIEEAKNLARGRDLPKKDALHAILARDNNLTLISRDRHFDKLKDIAVARKPEEFI